ncbi:MAG: hypothetical protein FWD88_01535, partial [Treponema sp.]|nr:hypothetical protein [Treponema sp.]
TADGTEGVFSIRVYARTEQGTTNAVPLMTVLTLDREPPVLELTQLDGSAGETIPGETTVGGLVVRYAGHLVNGVIRPRFFATDSRAVDSGHRVSGGYFARPDGRDAEEVMFLLVPDGCRETVEGLPGGFWPLPRMAGPTSVPVFPDGVNVTVARHGPVFDNAVYIQTSRSHADNRYDPLDDGRYWLYIFARDRAFNVGRASFPLYVDAASDRPVFDFGIGLMTPAVTDPNRSADGTPAGFNYGGTVRNMLRPTTDIRFRVRDADGLDLGVQGQPAASSLRVTFSGSFVDPQGVLRPLSDRDPGFLVELDGAALADFRPRDSLESPALRERDGTIRQADLLRLLRSNPLYRALHGDALDGLNSLPDGMYIIHMEVSDDPDFKLAMPGEVAGAAGAGLGFWVAVDNVPPQIDLAGIEPVNETYISRDQYIDIGSRLDGVGGYRGTVWDDNGPIEVRRFVVAMSQPDSPYYRQYVDIMDLPPPGGGIEQWVTLRRLYANQDTWEYVLAATVNLSVFFPGVYAGIFDFELTLADRFGNTRTVNRRHQMDEVPPTVALTRPMETFARASVVDRHGISIANARRLANGVVGFTAHAQDNFTVDGIRWWLLPYGIGASTGGALLPGGLNTAGTVESFDSFPARNYDALAVTPGRAYGFAGLVDGRTVTGAFGRIDSPGGNVYIDTRALGLQDGEYRLHIVAMDAWGNNSLPDNRYMQTVFLLQEEDRPYFSDVRPDTGDVRGEHSLLITGAIMDDDGFGRRIDPEPGSVRLWVSRPPSPGQPPRQPPPAYLSTQALDDLVGQGWLVMDVPNEFLILSGRDIILNIPLDSREHGNVLFAGLLDGPDGTIHYVIRARDSVDSKSQTPYAQDSVSRYRLFSFVLDTQPPEIELTSPSPDAEPHDRIFRTDFDFVGSIADVNLARTPEGRPHISWTLNGSTPTEFVIPQAYDTTPPGVPDGLDTVHFRIPATSLFGSRDFSGVPVPDLDDGLYTLELVVIDMIGMASVVTLNFTVDRSLPVIAANFPGLPVRIGHDDLGWFDWWHGEPTDPDARREWNESRRRWAAANDLPVILHGGGTVPVLTGSIVDEFSDIATAAVGFRFNDAEYPIPNTSVRWEGEGRNWRWEIPLAALPDHGVHTLSIENVGDRTGNILPAPAVFVFRLDAAEPGLALDHQHENYRVLGSPDVFPSAATVFDIGGEATGANLRGVRLRFREQVPGSDVIHEVYLVDDGATAEAGMVWSWDNTAGTTLAWTYGFDSADYLAAYFSPGRTYEIEVIALGWRDGSESEPATWVFTKDTEKPSVGFAPGLNVVPGSGALGANFGPGVLVEGHPGWNRFQGQTLVIQGTVSDSHSDIRTVESRVERWDSATGAWLVVTGRWNSVPADWGHIPDRNEWTPITGAELSGSPRDRIWRENLGQGALNLPDGLYRLRIRAMDSSWFVGSTDDFGPNSRGNPVYSDWLYFYYARLVPDIDFAVPPPLAMSSRYGSGTAGFAGRRFPGFLGFSVDVSDAMGIRYVRAGIDGIGASLVEVPVFALGMDSTVPTDAAFSVEIGGRTYRRQDRLVSVGAGGVTTYLGRWDAVNVFTIFVPPANAIEERHTVTITAEGLSGRQRNRIRNVELDNTPPSGAFASPEQAGQPVGGFVFGEPHLGSAPAVISGETFDRIPVAGIVESGVSRVDFRLGLLDGAFPTETALTNLYGDTAAGTPDVDTSPAWYRLDSGSPMPAGFTVARDILFSWQIDVDEGYLMARARLAGMSLRQGIYLDMPMWFRVVDGAGNAGYFHRIIRINEEADRPVNVIRNPSMDTDPDSPRGGSIFVEGVAQIVNTDVEVNSVLYRVWVGGTTRLGLTADHLPAAVPAGDEDLAFLAGFAGLGGGNWFVATADHGFAAPWSFDLNSDGSITDLIATHGFFSGSTPGGDNDRIRVVVEVVALNNLAGDSRLASFGPGSSANPLPDVRVFYVTSSAPRILNARVDGGSGVTAPADPGAPGIQALNNPHRGVFTVRATLDSGSVDSRISEIRILRPDEIADEYGDLRHGNMSVWGIAGSVFGPIPRAGVVLDPSPCGRFIDLAFTLDSGLTGPAPGATAPADRIRRGLWRDEGGSYYIEIRVYDDTTPPAVATLTLPIVIDNFAPVADPLRRGNPLQAGTGVFQGRVLDGASGAAIVDRIYVWFEGSGGPIAAGTTAIGTARPLGVLTGRTATLGGPDRSGVTVTAQGIIDNAFVIPAVAMEISAGTWGTIDGRANGHLWVDSHNERVVQWQFSTDTARLGDGPVTLRYVVVDTAGNASLFEQGIVIRNNFPEITRVVLHTSATGTVPDIEAGASLDPDTSVLLGLGPVGPGGYTEVDFAVRNRWLGFTVETARGNPVLHYHVQHVTRNEIQLTAGNVRAMIYARNNPAGATVANVYTVARYGTVAPEIWIGLGVGNPVAGTHFVFMPTGMDEIWPDAAGEMTDENRPALPIWVWQYTILNDVSAGPFAHDNGLTAVVPGQGLEFTASHFVGGQAPVVANPIPHFVLDRRPGLTTGQQVAAGSGPDWEDRPFFLIRVWDSVIPSSHIGGTLPPGFGRTLNVNDQLHAMHVVAMDVRLRDTMPPTVMLHDLNPALHTGGVTTNLTDETRA